MNIIKELTLEETSLKEEMKNNCLTKGKYIDDKAKDKFKMLCHLEDFEVQYHTLNKGIDELIEKYEYNLSISSELLKVSNDNENILGAIKDNANCINYQGILQDLKKLKGE